VLLEVTDKIFNKRFKQKMEKNVEKIKKKH